MTTEERTEDQVGDWGVLGLGVLVGIVVVMLLVAAYAIGAASGDHVHGDAASSAADATETTTGPSPEAVVDQQALTLFTTSCGGCHTLAEAGTEATIGPDLDSLAPTAEQVLAAIENGGSGSGQMPAGLLSGEDAQRVAALVGKSPT